MQKTKFNELEIVKTFQGTSLSEMDEVKLMNRTDTKFVIKRTVFNELLPLLKNH